MFAVFTSDKQTKFVDISKFDIEKVCIVLFPEYVYKNNGLYSKEISNGYFYDSVKEVKVYDVKVIDLDSELQDTLDKNLIYIKPMLEDDSDSGSICSVKTSQLVFGSGYSGNMITNTFCGFGFEPYI